VLIRAGGGKVLSWGHSSFSFVPSPLFLPLAKECQTVRQDAPLAGHKTFGLKWARRLRKLLPGSKKQKKELKYGSCSHSLRFSLSQEVAQSLAPDRETHSDCATQTHWAAAIKKLSPRQKVSLVAKLM